MELKSLIVEYLIIIKQEGSFCNSDRAFLNFLCVDSSITISTRQKLLEVALKKNNKLSVQYTLDSDLVPSGKERYFKLTLLSKEPEKVSDFDALTKLLEKIISKLHPEISINVLWNDISRLYAIEGYALINEVENLLRRLIASFMLTKVGFDYPKYHIPSEVGNRDQERKSNYTDYLHQTYFSDLKTILFEGQREVDFRNIGEIQRFVERHISEGKTEIKVADIQGVISRSLWEKHFSQDTDYRKDHLEADLETLNKLRNEIAHNRHISRETLGKIKSLSSKIIKALKLEIAQLDNKKLSSEEINFQIDTQNKILSTGNSFMRGRLTEKAVMEWYQKQFNSGRIVMTEDYDRGMDFLVELDSAKSLAVEVKTFSVKRLKPYLNEIIRRGVLPNIPDVLSRYSEFHLVISFTDLEEKLDLTLLTELKERLSSISANTFLILGCLDENGVFQTINFQGFS